MISSTSNHHVKQINALIKKAKFRNEEGLFIVEGIKMFEELPKKRIERVYLTEELAIQKSYEQILSQQHIPYELVTEAVFKAMSDTQSPQGILAVVKQYHYTLDDLLLTDKPAHLLILERIQDPGNLGTMIRAGEGAGITGIVMDEGTVDLYNPKVIRATMGSIYRVPFIYCQNLSETMTKIKERGVCIYAAHLAGKNSYDQECFQKPTAFLIGNEASGLSDEAALAADVYLRIPMEGKVESLNAAIAASVLMFEVARQRR